MNDKCTVILPVYNASPFLCRCLDSLCKQTYKNFLVYAINDGSTDNSDEILQSYAKNDDRFLVYQIENGGAAQARNYVLDKIETDYVFFLDSDDWIENNTLEILIDLTKKYNADIVQCHFQYDYPNQKSYIPTAIFQEEQFIERNDFKKTIYKKIFFTINLNHITHTLFRAKIIRDLTLNQYLRTGEDLYFMIDAFQNANSYVYTKKALYHYFIRKDSLTGLSITLGEKLRCNLSISNKIAANLKKWDMNYPQYYIMAYLRLAIICCTKIIRILINIFFANKR